MGGLMFTHAVQQQPAALGLSLVTLTAGSCRAAHHSMVCLWYRQLPGPAQLSLHLIPCCQRPVRQQHVMGSIRSRPGP